MTEHKDAMTPGHGKVDTSAAAIAALMDGVTPGPWGISFRRDGTGYICMGSPHGGPHKQFDIRLEKGYSNDERDAEFIGSARDLLPALSTELTALRAERDARQQAQPYRYIGKDGKPILARDLEDQRDAALARVGGLEYALELATRPRTEAPAIRQCGVVYADNATPARKGADG